MFSTAPRWGAPGARQRTNFLAERAGRRYTGKEWRGDRREPPAPPPSTPYGPTSEASRHEEHRPTDLRRLQRLRPGAGPGNRRGRVVQLADEVRLRDDVAGRRPPDRLD